MSPQTKTHMEVISFHIPIALLEEIDRLVREGVYPNRSEVIRDAIRNLLMQYRSSGEDIGNGNIEHVTEADIEQDQKDPDPPKKDPDPPDDPGPLDDSLDDSSDGENLDFNEIIAKVKMLPPLKRSLQKIADMIRSARGRRICVAPASFTENHGEKMVLRHVVEAILWKANVNYEELRRLPHNRFCFSSDDREKVLGVFQELI